MKIVCISDTHSLHRHIPEIPDGDVLIHAGDSLGQGRLDNIEDLNDWLGTLPHPRSTTLINASSCTEWYEPTNRPIVFELT